MIIVGAGSAGIETVGIFRLFSNEKIVFFDNKKEEKFILNVPVISSENELKKEIIKDPRFCVSIGNPRIRKKMFDYLLSIGGKPTNIISHDSYNLSSIPDDGGIIIQPGVRISYDLKIGLSTFIHANAVIGHKVFIGDFVNISPLCGIIGPSSIGDFSYIGTGTIIYPGITIGKHVYIAPGSVVKRNLSDYETFEE